MSLYRLVGIAALGLVLAACQTVFQPSYRKPLEVTRDASEVVKPGCSSSDCPLVNIDTVHFPDEPRLDELTQQALLRLTRSDGGAPTATTLKGYQQQFLSTAEPHWASYLQAKVREQHDGLVIVELSSYLQTGGAHGDPGRELITWSRQQQKVLTLADMLIPGQEAAFWDKAQLAHIAWLNSTDGTKDPAFVKDWPFRKTGNIALTYGAVILKYPVTTIAPYAMGHVELKIPYPQLNGVIRPELFPGRG